MNPKLKRNIIVILVAGLFSLSIVSGFCAAATLRIAVHAGGHATPFYETKDQFETENPGAVIQVVEIPVTEMYEKQITEMAGKTGAYDIVEYAPSWLGDYQRFLLPIDDYMAKWNPNWDDILPAVRKTYSIWKGKTYGIPEDGDVHTLYYRKDALENPMYQAQFKAKYGYDLRPPLTWQEYLDIAEFFNGWDWDGDGKIEYGCSEMARRGEVYFWFLQRFGPMGGKYFLADFKPAIDSPAGIAALENLGQAVKYAPPGTLNFEYTEHEHAFISGQVFMNLNWGSQFHAAQDPEVSEVVGKVGYALSPGILQPDGSIYRRPCLAYGWSLGIVNTCSAPEVAYKYIKFLTSPEISKKFIMATNTDTDPFRTSHFTDPEIIHGHEDYYRVAKKGLEIGYPQLTIPKAYSYMDTLDREISSYLAGKKTAEHALKDAAKAWERLGRPPYAPIPQE